MSIGTASDLTEMALKRRFARAKHALRKRLRFRRKRTSSLIVATANGENLHSATENEILNQAEVGHSMRGSITLRDARICTDNALNFVVCGGSQTYHLKAASENERQKWVNALEVARHRAIKAADSDEDEELKIEADEISHGDAAGTSKQDVQNVLRTLETKMDNLRTCQELIAKHGTELLRCVGEVERTSSSSGDSLQSKTKAINERATLFRITVNAMINACNEFVDMGGHFKKWSRLLQHEHQQRMQLQQQLEQLARQHSCLEKMAMQEQKPSGEGAPSNPGDDPVPIISLSPYSTEDDDEFHDAVDDLEDDNRLGVNPTSGGSSKLKRHGSHTSCDASEFDRKVINRDIDFNAEIVTSHSADSDDDHSTHPPTPTQLASPTRERRSVVPFRPQVGLNLWSIMRNCIGKELSKIPMPVNFNEPLSMLQRITEDMEYANILDRAATKTDSAEQLAYVAAYTVSSYSTTANRTTKPFNPLLGETFECDRVDDLGWKAVTEQVSHHPPAAAMHVDGKCGWTLYQDCTITSKFRGKYLSVIPMGVAQLEFADSGNHYTWRKVTTTVHNIIVGKLWVDNHGDMIIENHKTGDKCYMKFVPYSYFARDIPRKVTGVVKDRAGVVRWVLRGTWDDHIDAMKVVRSKASTTSADKPDKSVHETLHAKRIWTVNPPVASTENMYHFTKLAVELNEPEDGIAPTDSRLRPDQRLMEDGRWDEANQLKLKLEEKQRQVRRRKEADAEQAMIEGRSIEDYEPVWFRKAKDDYTGAVIHRFKNDYWKCKDTQSWAACPQIFQI